MVISSFGLTGVPMPSSVSTSFMLSIIIRFPLIEFPSIISRSAASPQVPTTASRTVSTEEPSGTSSDISPFPTILRRGPNDLSVTINGLTHRVPDLSTIQGFDRTQGVHLPSSQLLAQSLRFVPLWHYQHEFLLKLGSEL